MEVFDQVPVRVGYLCCTKLQVLSSRMQEELCDKAPTGSNCGICDNLCVVCLFWERCAANAK